MKDMELSPKSIYFLVGVRKGLHYKVPLFDYLYSLILRYQLCENSDCG